MRLSFTVSIFLATTICLLGQTPDELNSQAMELNKKGETKKAVGKLEKSLKENPTKKETYFILGGILFVSNEFKRAEENLRKAVELDSNYVEPYDYLSAISFSNKNVKKGIRYLDKSIELQPTVTRLLGRADMRGMTGDYQGSIKDCDEILRIDPNNPNAYFTRGNSKFGLRDKPGACADLRRAIELGKTKDAFFIKYCEN